MSQFFRDWITARLPSLVNGRFKKVDPFLKPRHLLRLDLQIVDVPQTRHQDVLRSFQLLQKALPEILSHLRFFFPFCQSAGPVFLQMADTLLRLVEPRRSLREAESRLL